MERINQVMEKVEDLMETPEGISSIELPALREVMEHVVTTKQHAFGYSKHSDHSKTSTKGCPLGCLGG